MKNTILPIGALFAILGIQPVHATTEHKNFNAALQCRAIENDTNRLSCYDDLFPQERKDEPIQEKAGDTGKWQTSTTTSPIDDSKNVILSLTGENYVQNTIGESVTPVLYIACRENKTEVFLDWRTYLGLEQTQMLYRLDKQKAVERSWRISTNSEAVSYDGNNIDFIHKLANADKMYTQITPYGENPIDTTFDLSGLKNALIPLQNACNWK